MGGMPKVLLQFVLQRDVFDLSNIQPIYDTDPSLDYTGSWVLNSTNTQENKQIITLTSHSTAQNLSTVFVPFNGSQIHVIGMIPAGDGPLTANYTVDNGQPISRTEPTLSQNSSLSYQMLFVSPILPIGQHNLTIKVLETGVDRNYTLQSFFAMSDGDGEGNDMATQGHGDNNGGNSNKNIGAIVGGVLGTVILLLIFILGVFYFWRRKRLAQISNGGQKRLPPMMYYARPMSDGTPRGRALYMLEPGSVIDTDSKFTFGVHRDIVDEPRRSWVPVSMPPSMPESAVVSDRPISDWSSYKGLSVIVEQSHVERSRFSPYTATTFSPMAFREPTPPPVPRRITGPPLKIETLTTTSSSSDPYQGRMF